MLKPKIVKVILDEVGLSYLAPFTIEGESTPYRVKKDGSIERFKGQAWIDSSYSYYDLVSLIDSERLKKYNGTPLVEYFATPKETVRRRRRK